MGQDMCTVLDDTWHIIWTQAFFTIIIIEHGTVIIFYCCMKKIIETLSKFSH